MTNFSDISPSVFEEEKRVQSHCRRRLN